MAYYITVKDKEGYKSIDISNHYLFDRKSKYKGDRYSLEEIDKFTSNYANELALKEALLFEGIVDENEVYKDISIRMKMDSELVKVMYDPVFIESSKYLDINYLTYKIKTLACDYDFLNKLINHYRNSHINNETVACIREFTFGNPEINIYNLLDQFIFREIYNHRFDYEKKDYVIDSIKYKSLHDLAMFVYNYENKNTLTKDEINEELRKFIYYLKGEDKETKEKTPTKKVQKRIKGKNEGQISFLD